nr:hypothetical protein [uncultured Arsenicibacter sp.]
MTPLSKAIASLSIVNPLLFRGMYIPYSLEGYDPDYDELSLVIIGTGAEGQYAFTLCIQPCVMPLTVQAFYLVEVSYFGQMQCSRAIPEHLILDFLLHAKLYVATKQEMMLFEYPDMN